MVGGRPDTDGHNQPGAGASGVSPVGRSGAEEARQRLDAPLAEAIHARSPGTVHEHRNTGRGRRDYGSTPATRTTAAGWAAPGPG